MVMKAAPNPPACAIRENELASADRHGEIFKKILVPKRTMSDRKRARPFFASSRFKFVDLLSAQRLHRVHVRGPARRNIRSCKAGEY